MTIISNYNSLCEDVRLIAENAGRNPDEIKIIAVSKTFSPEIVQEAIDSGISVIGENKVQEAKTKSQILNGEFSIHMIGHLQSNKAKEAVKIFDCIHSIDKVSTALKLNEAAAQINKKQKIFIQVNVSGEETKSGVSEKKLLNISRDIADLQNVEILGLMTMAPYTDDTDVIRQTFRRTSELLHEINSKLSLTLKELSMGMSSDYALAVEEGATMIRVGSLIFGQRNYT